MADQQQRLVLHQAQVGPMANFVYLIGDPLTRKAAVVDPPGTSIRSSHGPNATGWRSSIS